MGAETLFADLPLGALTANAAEAALGDVLIGVDQLGDDSVEFGYHFSAGATDLIVPGETGTLFVVDNNDGGTNLPFLFVRTANPETGATYAAALAVDPLTLQYDVVVGEGSLAPTAPAALALPIESGSLVYTRTLDVTGCATVDSLVVGVDIPHEYRNDLLIELTSPGGTKVTLNYSQFSSGADFVGAFVDGATGAGLYTPDEPLSNFAGGNGNGTWTLYVEDTYASGDDGTFNGWSLALMCTNN
ncbi:MAG: hypothetical protein EP329_19565 [Deltaproteobacteria bacterium]|nr:MAG: hypothetical protein EP329_19565 [Deltaproteobacteria bacterium]